jgi:hypothetical protein
VACLVMTRSVPTRRAVAVPVPPLWAQDEPAAAKEAGCGPAAAARAIKPGRRLPVWPKIVGQLPAGRRCPETMRRLSDGRCRNGERQRRRRRCVTSFARNNNANDDRRKFRCLGPGERVWGLIDSGVSQSRQQGSCAPRRRPASPRICRARSAAEPVRRRFTLPGRRIAARALTRSQLVVSGPETRWGLWISVPEAQNPLMATIVHNPL